MSKSYDIEIVYSETESQKRNSNEIHHKATYGGRIFKVGDIVQLASYDKQREFGKVLFFQTRDDIDGQICYIRIPEEIYGSKIEVRATRHVMKNKSNLSISKEYNLEKIKLLAVFPSSLAFDWKTGHFQDMGIPPEVNVRQGYEFPDCYISILGAPTKTNSPHSISNVRMFGSARNRMLILMQILQVYNEETNE